MIGVGVTIKTEVNKYNECQYEVESIFEVCYRTCRIFPKLRNLGVKFVLHSLNSKNNRGTWVAQLVKHLTSAEVMISLFVSLSLVSGSVLTAQSLEPALDSVSPSLPLPCSHSFCLSPSKKYINIKIIIIIIINKFQE